MADDKKQTDLLNKLSNAVCTLGMCIVLIDKMVDTLNEYGALTENIVNLRDKILRNVDKIYYGDKNEI